MPPARAAAHRNREKNRMSQSDEKNPASGGGAKKITPRQAVDEARLRFWEAAACSGPLETVARHPALSVGAAFALGLAGPWLRKGVAALPLVPLLARVASLAGQVAVKKLMRP